MLNRRSNRMWMAAVAALVATATWLAAPGEVLAGPEDGEDGKKVSPIPPETIGTWRFRDDSRPIKVVNLGGSVAAWPRGGYSQFVEAACPRVEVVNRAKSRIGGPQLKERFIKQVLKNRRVHIGEYESAWLIFHGGLNSVSTPEMTNKYLRDIFRKAHKAGMKVVALSLGPWGSSKRWRYGKGLRYDLDTRLTVDFVMGRVKPAKALGRYARSRKNPEWDPAELPDIAVDLYDSVLRDREAELADADVVRRYLKRDRWVKRQLKDAPEADREALLTSYVERTRALGRWFMKKDLQAFDSIHPNMEGHRLIAEKLCPKLPQEWGCDCQAIASMKWGRKGLEPLVKAASAD